jgi:hypothetical protein
MVTRILYSILILGGVAGIVTPGFYVGDSDECLFKNPDTSVAGIKIRDGASIGSILGKNSRLEGDSTHHYYSKNKIQVLSLTVHPGDGDNLVSIFKVSWFTADHSNIQQSNIAGFDTEKGIHLGMSKSALISILGKCFTSTIDKQVEVISYKIENPYDSRTGLLGRHNMPVYFGEYYFRGNKLEQFEFGFEYP